MQAFRRQDPNFDGAPLGVGVGCARPGRVGEFSVPAKQIGYAPELAPLTPRNF
jgi:hypothetical protein